MEQEKKDMVQEVITVELCGGRMPEKAHATDAAFDVFTREDVELEPYLRLAVPLGFKMQLPGHLAAVVQPRSGMSLKGMSCKIRTTEGEVDGRVDADVTVGLVDSGYTGEVCALVRVGCGALYDRPNSKHGVYIPAGTKIAQMRIVYVPGVEFVDGVIDKDTERGDGGFNSTGVR